MSEVILDLSLVELGYLPLWRLILELLKIHTFHYSQVGLHQVSILLCKSWHSFLFAFIFKSWFRILTITTCLLFANVGGFLLLMVSQMDFDPTILFSRNCSCNLRRSLSISKNSGNTFFVSTLNNTQTFQNLCRVSKTRMTFFLHYRFSCFWTQLDGSAGFFLVLCFVC